MKNKILCSIIAVLLVWSVIFILSIFVDCVFINFTPILFFIGLPVLFIVDFITYKIDSYEY